jgi:hypothetical protein
MSVHRGFRNRFVAAAAALACLAALSGCGAAGRVAGRLGGGGAAARPFQAVRPAPQLSGLRQPPPALHLPGHPDAAPALTAPASRARAARQGSRKEGPGFLREVGQEGGQRLFDLPGSHDDDGRRGKR